jgi:hypothetical protein
VRTLASCSLALASLGGCLFSDDDGSDRPATAPPLPTALHDAPCSEYDLGGNGTTDIVYAFTYDSAGFMTMFVGTPGPDVGQLSYDRSHFLLRWANNLDDDPEPEQEQLYTRDDYGRVLSSEVRSIDGSWQRVEYQRDPLGRMTRADYSYSNSTPFTTTLVYEGTSLQPREGRQTYQSGSSKLLYTVTNDERSVRIDIDDGEDGTIDRTTDQTFDQARRLVGDVYRQGGTVVRRRSYTYSPRGHVATYRLALGDDSVLDAWVFTATFDGRGMLIEEVGASPSGEYASEAFRQSYKTSCSSARTAAEPAARRPSPRPALEPADLLPPPIGSKPRR